MTTQTKHARIGDRILKVNHAGEFGAINIYRSQILLGKVFRRSYVPKLEDLIEHEKGHHATFAALLNERGIQRCRSYWLCGIGGWALGLVTSLLGQRGVMACTAAVENVVLTHLYRQKDYLDGRDPEAHAAVVSIMADEQAHRDIAEAEGGDNRWYRPIRFLVAQATEVVIWLGMKL